MAIHLLAYPPNSSDLKAIPLALNEVGTTCMVELQTISGANYLRLILLDSETEPAPPFAAKQVVFRGDIRVHGLERLQVHFQSISEQTWEARCTGREVLLLQNHPETTPLYESVIAPVNDCQAADLMIVIDATCRLLTKDNKGHATSGLLLGNNNNAQWQTHIDKLCAFIDTLRAKVKELRVGVLAFADYELNNVEAADLKPKFVLFPENDEERRALLLADSSDLIKEKLLQIPASSGGDFVDALADALAACHDVYWQPSARKWLLISGESPGYSIEQPLDADRKDEPRGDACVRLLDVDTEALRLHRKGVELLTLYHSQPDEYLSALFPTPKKLQTAAKEQFKRLACLPQFAFDTAQFEGEKEALAILNTADLIGHGGCCGISLLATL